MNIFGNNFMQFITWVNTKYWWYQGTYDREGGNMKD